MALEINEIGIHFRVPDSDGPVRSTPGAVDMRDQSEGCGDDDRARIVDDCVRRVLQLLAARRER